MTQILRDIRFEQLPGHDSVVLRWKPAGPIRARAVFFPAFGDEMNQTRRMVRLTAEALAERGVASCVFDLYGTGDSSAEFVDATVERWLKDCVAIVERTEANDHDAEDGSAPVSEPVFLVGCRLGVALAVRASRALARPAAALIGWAPIFQGKQQLNAMLRAEKIGRMQRGAGGRCSEPKALWDSGEAAWLGGYPISSILAKQLDALDAGGAPKVGSAILIDVRVPVADEPVVAAEPLRRRGTEWAAQGVPTAVRAVAGAGFWNVADLVDVSELVAVTVAGVEQVLVADETQPTAPSEHGNRAAGC